MPIVQVAQGDQRDGRRRYSFVDVLERVTDGVHVHVVGREPKPPARSRAEDAPERPKRRRQPSHDRKER